MVVVDGTCCRPTYPDTYYGIRLGDAPPNGLSVDGAGVQVGHPGRARRRRRRVVQVLSMSWELELLNPSTGLVLVSVQSPIDHIDRYSGGQEKKKKIATNMVNERQQTSATPGTGYTHSRTVQTGEGTKKNRGEEVRVLFFFVYESVPRTKLIMRRSRLPPFSAAVALGDCCCCCCCNCCSFSREIVYAAAM